MKQVLQEQDTPYPYKSSQTWNLGNTNASDTYVSMTNNHLLS
jgi:hypothetical protein